MVVVVILIVIMIVIVILLLMDTSRLTRQQSYPAVQEIGHLQLPTQ